MSCDHFQQCFSVCDGCTVKLIEEECITQSHSTKRRHMPMMCLCCLGLPWNDCRVYIVAAGIEVQGSQIYYIAALILNIADLLACWQNKMKKQQKKKTKIQQNTHQEQKAK